MFHLRALKTILIELLVVMFHLRALILLRLRRYTSHVLTYLTKQWNTYVITNQSVNQFYILIFIHHKQGRQWNRTNRQQASKQTIYTQNIEKQECLGLYSPLFASASAHKNTCRRKNTKKKATTLQTDYHTDKTIGDSNGQIALWSVKISADISRCYRVHIV